MTNQPENTPKSGDDQWHYWFNLKTDALAGRWELLRQRLGQEPEYQLPSHPFTNDVFHAAANAGETDIIETLFERGFTKDEETLAETIKRLAIYHADKSADVIRLLLPPLRAGDPTDAIYAAAAAGRIDSLKTLDEAGVDVRAGDTAFFLALYKGHVATMNYLYDKGAGLYHPAVLAAQYGRRGELPAENASITLGVYRDLVDIDNQPQAELYAAAGKPRNIADLRENISDEQGHVYTRLQLAIRAGQWADVREAAAADKTQTLTADDFLTKDGRGQRAIDMMAARGKLTDVFDAAIWYRNPQEVWALHGTLRDIRAEKSVNTDALMADMQRHELRDIAPTPDAFRLKPRARKP